MDANSKDKEPSEIKKSAITNAENASFILGTGKLVTPQKLAAGVTPYPYLCTPDTFKSPLNFSTVTIEQLGITPESFVKNSSGKSSSYLKKSRRRSTVGIRGSPETNHLIRFIAQQRNLKNAKRSPLAQDSPFQGSPGLYRNVNSLRERISAFQSAFHSIKENEKMPDCPEFSEVERGSEPTGLSNMEGLRECQQSGNPENLSCKRRRISSQSSPEDSLSNAERRVMDLQIRSVDVGRTCMADASVDLPKKSSELGVTQLGCVVEESSPCPVHTEGSSEQVHLDILHLSPNCVHLEGLQVPDCVEGTGSNGAMSFDTLTAEVSSGTDSEVKLPATTLCKRDILSTETFVLRSVLKKPGKLFAENLQENHDNLCDDLSHPSLISNLSKCCKEQKAEDQENFKAPAFLNVRKRKRVTFGEDLSPEVFDESLPANTPLRKGGTPVRQKDFSSLSSLQLEQSPVSEQLPQPNFDDKGENLENIEPLQVSFAVLSPNKSSVSENLPGTDTFSSPNNHEKISSRKVSRLTRTSNRRNQLTSFAEENICNLYNAEAQPCKEKKTRKKSQENKCTNRALPKKNQVLKSCRKKKGKGKKHVEKSLYGERDMASKKPLLSPIPELPEVCEMTPLVTGVRRIYSDGCNSNSNLEEVKPLKIQGERNSLWPQSPEDLCMQQGLGETDKSELCSSYRKTSSLPGSKEPSTNIMDVEDHGNIPKAGKKLESESASITETGERIVSGDPELDFILQCQESAAAAGQDSEGLCPVYKVSKDRKCKEQEDFIVAAEGKMQCNPLTYDSQKEFNCLEDVLIRNIKETKCHSYDVGRKSTENSVTSCREKKHRRRSMYYSDGQSLHLEQNGNREPSYSVGSFVEISLENSKLYKDLSDAIEQTFQRTNSETKVRRSTRFQKDSENEGLVWVSLPHPSSSQKPKRRTICTLDCRGFENMSLIKETPAGEESSKGLAAECLRPPRRRRRSFCAPRGTSMGSTSAQPTHCRRSLALGAEGTQLTSPGVDTTEK